MNKKTLVPKPYGLLCACLLALPMTANAYSQLYVFGDSLSDGGNNGRYTYNGHQYPLYNEGVAHNYGLTLTPSTLGGNNFAAGGAVAVPSINPNDNTENQVKQYLQQHQGKADGNGLYVHWIGGNDLAAGVAAAILNPASGAQLVATSAQAAASQIKSLQQAGATTIIVPTAPNIALTPALLDTLMANILTLNDTQKALAAAHAIMNSSPITSEAVRQQRIKEAISAGVKESGAWFASFYERFINGSLATASEQAQQLTHLYNHTQDRLLAQNGGDIVRVDVNALLHEVTANPTQYGFNNIGGTACPSGLTASQCSTDSPGFNHALAFLFADNFHPSPTTHAILSQYMVSVLEAPIQVAYLSQSMNQPITGVRTTLDGRRSGLQQPDATSSKLGVFGGYAGLSGAQHQANRQDEGRQRSNNLTLGLDYALTPNLTVGALISGHKDTERPSKAYQYRHRGNVVAAFAQARFAHQGWLGVDLHRSRSNFENIARRIDLGPATRTETGSTKGREWGIRLGTGWDFIINPQFSTGPMAQYAWDKSKVDAYAETADLSTSMRFSEQRRTSKIAAIGWRFDTTLGSINPYANIRYLRQLGDRSHAVSSGLKSTLTSFSRETAADARSWADLTVGANVNLNKNLQAFAALSRTNGLKQGEQTRYSFGLSAGF